MGEAMKSLTFILFFLFTLSTLVEVRQKHDDGDDFHDCPVCIPWTHTLLPGLTPPSVTNAGQAVTRANTVSNPEVFNPSTKDSIMQTSSLSIINSRVLILDP